MTEMQEIRNENNKIEKIFLKKAIFFLFIFYSIYFVATQSTYFKSHQIPNRMFTYT